MVKCAPVDDGRSSHVGERRKGPPQFSRGAEGCLGGDSGKHGRPASVLLQCGGSFMVQLGTIYVCLQNKWKISRLVLVCFCGTMDICHHPWLLAFD
jgi:hypothetical protein